MNSEQCYSNWAFKDEQIKKNTKNTRFAGTQEAGVTNNFAFIKW